MKTKGNVSLLCLIGMLVPALGWAEQTNYAIGGVAGQELRMGLGARPAAMAGAFTGLADDVDAVSWNPAGLVYVRGMQFEAMHYLYLADIACEYIAYAQPWSQNTGLGAAVAYYNFGSFERMDESGLPGSSFSPLALQATVGYGHRLLPDLSWGFGLKILHERIDTEQYSAVGMDLGLQWQAPAGFKAGFVAQNLGTTLADSDLARQVKVGLARELPWLAQSGDVWNAALDVDMPLADARYTAVHVGMEYWYQHLMALRLGYQLKNNENLSGAFGLTAGLGVRYSIYGLDYSLVSFGDLGLTHQLALRVSIQ